MAPRPPKPAKASWIAPYLTVRDPDASLAFYAKAFGFEKRFSMPGPDGKKTMHAEMVWQDGSFMMGAEGEHNECKAPASSGTRSPISLYVYCQDVDALCKRAIAAGAKAEQQPKDMFWGDRMCTLVDPDGHIWNFATNVADFDPSKAPQGGC